MLHSLVACLRAPCRCCAWGRHGSHWFGALAAMKPGGCKNQTQSLKLLWACSPAPSACASFCWCMPFSGRLCILHPACVKPKGQVKVAIVAWLQRSLTACHLCHCTFRYFYDITDRSNFKANPDYKGVCHVALAQVGQLVSIVLHTLLYRVFLCLLGTCAGALFAVACVLSQLVYMYCTQRV